MSQRYDYYRKNNVLYRAPHGEREVAEKQVRGRWQSHTRDPLPVEYGAFLGTGGEDGELEPEHPEGV